jgi:hypothetical protein
MARAIRWSASSALMAHSESAFRSRKLDSGMAQSPIRTMPPVPQAQLSRVQNCSRKVSSIRRKRPLLEPPSPEQATSSPVIGPHGARMTRSKVMVRPPGPAQLKKENPRTYATTGGFQFTLPTGLGNGGRGDSPAGLRGMWGSAEELPPPHCHAKENYSLWPPPGEGNRVGGLIAGAALPICLGGPGHHRNAYL